MVEVVPSLGSGLMAHMGVVSVGLGSGVRTLAAASGGFLERGYLPWPAPSPGGYMCQLLETSNFPLLFMKL